MTAAYTKTEYISVADTAKLVRKALAENFPGVKFSVKSKSYSGGASIRVEWQDGPTGKQVGAVTGKFTGASFDAMIDLKSYHSQEHEGRTVHFGADYINLSRLYSAAFLTSVAERTAKKWGQPVPVITDSRYWGATINDPGKPVSGYFDMRDLTLQDAAKTFLHNGLRCMEKGY